MNSLNSQQLAMLKRFDSGQRLSISELGIVVGQSITKKGAALFNPLVTGGYIHPTSMVDKYSIPLYVITEKGKQALQSTDSPADKTSMHRNATSGIVEVTKGALVVSPRTDLTLDPSIPIVNEGGSNSDGDSTQRQTIVSALEKVIETLSNQNRTQGDYRLGVRQAKYQLQQIALQFGKPIGYERIQTCLSQALGYSNFPEKYALYIQWVINLLRENIEDVQSGLYVAHQDGTYEPSYRQPKSIHVYKSLLRTAIRRGYV